MATFEAIFKNTKGLETAVTIKQAEIDNRLKAYNYICTNKLGKGRGKLVEIRELPEWGNSLNN